MHNNANRIPCMKKKHYDAKIQMQHLSPIHVNVVNCVLSVLCYFLIEFGLRSRFLHVFFLSNYTKTKLSTCYCVFHCYRRIHSVNRFLIKCLSIIPFYMYFVLRSHFLYLSFGFMYRKHIFLLHSKSPAWILFDFRSIHAVDFILWVSQFISDFCSRCSLYLSLVLVYNKKSVCNSTLSAFILDIQLKFIQNWYRPLFFFSCVFFIHYYFRCRPLVLFSLSFSHSLNTNCACAHIHNVIFPHRFHFHRSVHS